MAYLMSDVAAGSDAALRLQQNMAAAPYVQQETAAAAEQTQLKLQQDRLKAQYAPQEAAAKAEQDQLNLQKIKLANVVTQAQIKIDDDKKSAIQKLTSSADWSNKSLSDKTTAIAAAIAPIDPEGAGKLITQAAMADYRESQAASKQSELDYKTLSSAYSTISNATPEQIPALLNQMSDEQKKQITDRIPKFFEEKNPELQKKQLENLMLTGSQQVMQQKLANDLLIHQRNNEALIQAAIIRGQYANQAKLTGNENKEDVAATKLYDTMVGQIDRKYQKTRDKAEADLEDAQLKIETSRAKSWFGHTDQSALAAAEFASNKLKELDNTILQEQIAAAKRLPRGQQRNAILATLTGVEAPEENVPGVESSTAPKVAAPTGGPLPPSLSGAPVPKQEVDKQTKQLGGTVPSNKPAAPKMSDEDKQALEWAKANPKDPRAAKIRQRLGV